MTVSLPATAVVRVSSASFDPSRFAEVDAMNAGPAEGDDRRRARGGRGGQRDVPPDRPLPDQLDHLT